MVSLSELCYILYTFSTGFLQSGAIQYFKRLQLLMYTQVMYMNITLDDFVLKALVYTTAL